MQQQNRIRYAIIAGANKCGTTSLFRYLASHPEVCPSEVKETRFFLSSPRAGAAELRAAYDMLFVARPGAHVRLEATPGYLNGGARVATRIAEALPDCRLIFMLRSPGDRLISYFRSQASHPQSPCHGLTLDEFIERALASVTQKVSAPGPEAAFAREVRMGRYAELLLEYIEHVPAQRIKILFYETLATNPRSVTVEAAGFLRITSGFYDSYQFTVENRSRVHRSGTMRQIAAAANSSLEPVFNRLPRLRRTARALYDAVNAAPTAEYPGLLPARERLADYYRDANSHLARLLEKYWRDVPIPPWAAKL